MSYNPSLYMKSIEFSKVQTKNYFDEFGKWIHLREDGNDSFLDIGTGPGNTFREVIYPHLPENFSRLVCSDKSVEMVDLQRKEFQGIDRSEVIDIESIDVATFERLETFDHITSFFCLMWCDQQIAMDNIYKLLKPGGDCFLIIVVDGPVDEAMFSVMEKPRWREYFIGWQDFYKYPYRNKEDPKGMGLNFMEKAGFVDIKVELRQTGVEFNCNKDKENFLRSLPDKFSKEISPDVEEEIFQERLRCLDKFQLGQYRDNTGRINKPSTRLILYGKKKK